MLLFDVSAVRCFLVFMNSIFQYLLYINALITKCLVNLDGSSGVKKKKVLK